MICPYASFILLFFKKAENFLDCITCVCECFANSDCGHMIGGGWLFLKMSWAIIKKNVSEWN